MSWCDISENTAKIVKAYFERDRLTDICSRYLISNYNGVDFTESVYIIIDKFINYIEDKYMSDADVINTFEEYLEAFEYVEEV